MKQRMQKYLDDVRTVRFVPNNIRIRVFTEVRKIQLKDDLNRLKNVDPPMLSRALIVKKETVRKHRYLFTFRDMAVGSGFIKGMAARSWIELEIARCSVVNELEKKRRSWKSCWIGMAKEKWLEKWSKVLDHCVQGSQYVIWRDCICGIQIYACRVEASLSQWEFFKFNASTRKRIRASNEPQCLLNVSSKMRFQCCNGQCSYWTFCQSSNRSVFDHCSGNIFSII